MLGARGPTVSRPLLALPMPACLPDAMRCDVTMCLSQYQTRPTNALAGPSSTNDEYSAKYVYVAERSRTGRAFFEDALVGCPEGADVQTFLASVRCAAKHEELAAAGGGVQSR